jgi:putative endonuclease
VRADLAVSTTRSSPGPVARDRSDPVKVSAMERAADEVVAWVYLLRCLADDSLYTGWTVDLARRLAAHQSGSGSRYTRSRLPVELALALPMPDAGTARREEARIKRLRRPEKLALIEISLSGVHEGVSDVQATAT